MPSQDPYQKTYLGDGVYAEFDGHQILLTTESAAIWLEPEVFANLVEYAKTVFEGGNQ